MWTEAAFDAILRQLAGRGLTLRLYRNDHAPRRGDVLDDFTECDFPGYAPVRLDAWTFEGGRAAHPRVAFTRGAGFAPAQSAFGFYYTDSAGAVLRSVRFEDAPHAFVNAGDETSVVPVLSISSEEAR